MKFKLLSVKKIFLSLTLMAGISQAATIHSVQYDKKNDELVFDLTYGGCNLDNFTLKFNDCLETYPYQTKAVLDDSQDLCPSMIRTTLRLKLTGLSCRPVHASICTKQSPAIARVFIPK